MQICMKFLLGQPNKEPISVQFCLFCWFLFVVVVVVLHCLILNIKPWLLFILLALYSVPCTGSKPNANEKKKWPMLAEPQHFPKRNISSEMIAVRGNTWITESNCWTWNRRSKPMNNLTESYYTNTEKKKIFKFIFIRSFEWKFTEKKIQCADTIELCE